MSEPHELRGWRAAKHCSFTVPATYHCDNHTPGDVLVVRIVGVGDPPLDPGWVYVETANGDEFPVQPHELTEVAP